MGVNILTASGRPTTLGDDAVQQLSASVAGTVLTALSPGYAEARTVWNAMIDRRPALIVQCTSADDVEATVRFARQHNLVIAVRGGGHNIAGNALVDDGLVIDLSKMQTVTVDPAAKRARVEPGATLALNCCTASSPSVVGRPLAVRIFTPIIDLESEEKSRSHDPYGYVGS